MIWMVLLHILAWVGIILTGLIAVLLLLCLFLLFSRLRYDVHVDKGAKIRVSATAKWLMSLVRVDFRMMDAKRRLRIRVFGRTLGRGKADEQEDSPEKPSPTEDEAAKEVASDAKHTVKKAAKKVADVAAEEVEEQAVQSGESETEGFFARIKMFIHYPDKGLILSYTKDMLVRLLRALRPKRFKVSGVIGFEDPSVTGQVLGAVGVITALTGMDIVLRGNFEEKEITVRGVMAGKVTLWALLWPIARWALRKPIWKIVKPMLFRREKKRRR